MGWWKCNCSGGIDYENKPSGHEGGSLINAIPNRDTIEDYYNGDAAADAMYVPAAILREWFENRTPKPTTEQLTALFTEKNFDPIFKHIDKDQLDKLIDFTWKEIDAIYNEAWGRTAYLEERVYICKFSFGGANRPKDKWWKLSGTDKQYADNYRAGKLPYWWHIS